MFTDMHLVLYILSVLTVSLNGKRAQKNALYVQIRLDSFIQDSAHNAMGISWMLDYRNCGICHDKAINKDYCYKCLRRIELSRSEIKKKIDIKTMPLGDLIRRIIEEDQDAAAEFERRWGIPFEQLGTANLQREGE
jgi:hypothetical protein